MEKKNSENFYADQLIIPDSIDGIVRKITSKMKPEKIILFGSYASGNVSKDSDIDLLIIMNTDLLPAERQRQVSRLLYPRIAPLDIVVKTPGEILKSQENVDPFINEILHNGIVLYARPLMKYKAGYKKPRRIF